MLKFYKKNATKILFWLNLSSGTVNIVFGSSPVNTFAACLAFFVAGMLATHSIKENG